MRKLLFLIAIGAMILCAQEPPAGGRGRGGAPHTNLKVLPDDANLIPAMRGAAAGLGVQCTFCHEQDRASDAKQEKVIARMMFQMVADLNSKMPADAKVKITCYTCHRGQQEPVSTPPAAQ